MSWRSLWLPLRERSQTWLATGALFIVYVATMARDLSLYDSSELAIAAVTLGLGHPPGQPLHTLLGHAFSWLPLPATISVVLASAVPGALCVVPATAIAQQLANDEIARRADRLVPWLLAPLGMHAAIWEPATRVEVYALASFLALWALARLTPIERTSRDIFAAGCALGLCASANPMIALCTGLVVAPSILIAIVRRMLSWRALPLAVLGGVLGLLPYAYVPLVALRRDVMVWGAPRDTESLFFYLSLGDYVANQQVTLPMFIDHATAFVPHTVRHGLLTVIVIGTLSHFVLGARSALGRWAPIVLLVLFVSVISFYVVWSLEIPDYDGYLMSALWLFGAGGVALCAQRFSLGGARLAIVLAVLLVGNAWLAAPHVLARTRSQDRAARALAERVLHEAPRGAVVIALVDTFSAPLLYLQEVERQRPDVVVLCHGLASSSWHWERIYGAHPDLARFAINGPGGRDARIARFLAANAQRPVRVESLAIGRGIGRDVCAGGLYLRTGPECATPHDPAQLQDATRVLAEQLAIVGDGSPSVRGALAHVAAVLGTSLWRLGESHGAYTALLAGVPSELIPPTAREPGDLSRAPALTIGLQPWRRGAALGDPGRNLFLASILAGTGGRPDIAEPLMHAAALTDLPEAVDVVSAAR
jgi:hypothetical protein